MQFIAKHLNDKFYLEKDQRISLRDKIFREVANPFPAKLVIEKERVFTEKSRSYMREKILNPLIKGGLLKLTIPDKPTSSKQKYYSEKR